MIETVFAKLLIHFWRKVYPPRITQSIKYHGQNIASVTTI